MKSCGHSHDVTLSLTVLPIFNFYHNSEPSPNAMLQLLNSVKVTCSFCEVAFYLEAGRIITNP
jgi:hypothetical protein